MPRVDLEEQGSKSQEWTLGTGTSSRSFEVESWSYVQHKDYQLHLLQKPVKAALNRPTMPATELQRLTYYRWNATQTFKIQYYCMRQVDFTSFYLITLLNLVFRTMPMNYVHTFLAAYCPDEHMFTSKMSPIFTGVAWMSLFCGLFQLVASADILALSMQFAIMGIYDSNPWYRCNAEHNRTHKCFEIDEFISYTKNYTFGTGDNANEVSFHNGLYVLSDPVTKKNVRFTAAPIDYFTLLNDQKTVQVASYLAIIWIGAGLCYKQLFRTYIWKFLSRCQTILLGIYTLSCAYLICSGLEQPMKFINFDGVAAVQDRIEFVKNLDMDMYATCATGPPVIQMLNARSGSPVNPGYTSILISISDASLYIFKSLTIHNLKSFVETRTSLPILWKLNNRYLHFYYWAFFFYFLSFGKPMLQVFYIINFLVDATIFIITYQLLLEMIVTEWRWARRWIVTIGLSVLGLTCSLCIHKDDHVYLYLYGTMIPSFAEAIVIFWVYPLGRLLDDIYFNNELPLTKIMEYLMMMTPFYYLIKLYKLINATISRAKFKVRKDVKPSDNMTGWPWMVPLAPFGLGLLFAVIKYLIIDKQNWRVLFRPRPDWGPREHVTRQLRKQFDSRDYIGSQASRYLSRNMLSKAQTPSHKLDIRYETAAERRRSTIVADSFRFENKDK